MHLNGRSDDGRYLWNGEGGIAGERAVAPTLVKLPS